MLYFSYRASHGDFIHSISQPTARERTGNMAATNLSPFRVIRGRDVGILLPGHSLKDFPDEYSKWLWKKDVCWAGVNLYWHAESYLKQFGKSMEMVICTNKKECHEFHKELESFAQRGLLITGEEFEGNVYTWWLGGGSTLYVFLQLLEEFKVERVLLIGGDGGALESESPYVYDVEGDEDGLGHLRAAHRRDAGHLNDNYYKLHLKLKVFNLSQRSNYECFEKVTYDELRLII